MIKVKISKVKVSLTKSHHYQKHVTDLLEVGDMLAPGFLSVMFLVTALYREYREIGSWQSHLEERGRIRFCSFCFCFPFKKVMLSVTLPFLLRPAWPFFTFFVPWDTDLPALGHSGFLALRLPASLGLWEALSGSGG